jgi:hypothetical protein
MSAHCCTACTRARSSAGPCVDPAHRILLDAFNVAVESKRPAVPLPFSGAPGDGGFRPVIRPAKSPLRKDHILDNACAHGAAVPPVMCCAHSSDPNTSRVTAS